MKERLLGTEAVRQLLRDVGYTEEPARDYRVILLYYRQGWPRWTIVTGKPFLPVSYLQQIVTKMIPILSGESDI
jgi:hypothetical protein